MGPHAPQLLLPAFAAVRREAEPMPVEWKDVAAVDHLAGRARAEWVEAQVAEIWSTTPERDSVVVAKSLGSVFARTAAANSLPAIWVTPLLRDPEVIHALRQATAPFVLVGGTSDPHWDGDLARRLTPYVLEFEGADHGLFVPGPLVRSAENLGALATASEHFLDETVWPS